MRRYGSVQFYLKLNTEKKTFFGVDEKGEQSSYSADTLNREISKLLNREIRCMKDNENGSFFLQDLWCEFHNSRIVVHTAFTGSEDFAETAMDLSKEYLDSILTAVNDCLRTNDICFPEGQVEYDGTFWMPVNLMLSARTVEWYLIQALEACNREEALYELSGQYPIRTDS